MRALISFSGYLKEHLGDDRRWLGVVEGDSPRGSLSFRLLDEFEGVGDPVWGGTGLARWGDKVVCAIQQGHPPFVILDESLELHEAISPDVGDVHGIAVREDALYVTCTAWDSLRLYHLPTCKSSIELFAFGERKDNHHVNSVFVDDGRVVVSYHHYLHDYDKNYGVVWDVTNKKKLHLPQRIRRIHNVMIVDGELAFCDSVGWKVLIGNMSVQLAGYAKGLDFCGDYFLAGASLVESGQKAPGRCAVQVFDRHTGVEVNRLEIPERWSIYDILVLE